MELYEAAHGPCTVCGQKVEEVSEYWCDSEKRMKPGSLYWTPLPEDVWTAIRPHLAPLFGPDKVQNVLFIPEHSKPFCGPQCSLAYHEERRHG